MANPAHVIVEPVSRLWSRLRGVRAGTPAADNVGSASLGPTPLPTIGLKLRARYFDKMRRNYQNKGARPHG